MSTAKFEVFGLRLLPQRLDMACWYASARMLLDWQANRRARSTAMYPPELDAESRHVRDDNNGIVNQQILDLAKRLGLKAVPPMTPRPEAIGTWLRHFGPLWVNGSRHIVVLGGIDGDRVLVYDPAPVNVGTIEWRSLDTWYYNGTSASSPDTSSSVQTVLLHCPEDFSFLD